MTRQRIFEQVFSDTPQERARLIIELEAERDNPFITVRLTEPQLKLLAAYMLLLPWPEFRALTLYHCLGYTEKKLRATLGFERPMGLIRYLQDRLCQCMGLGRPIAKLYWRRVCSRALDDYPFPEQPGNTRQKKP